MTTRLIAVGGVLALSILSLAACAEEEPVVNMVTSAPSESSGSEPVDDGPSDEDINNQRIANSICRGAQNGYDMQPYADNFVELMDMTPAEATDAVEEIIYENCPQYL